MYRAIIQPPSWQPQYYSWQTQYYKPRCVQYENSLPGFIQRSPDGIITQGNCSPNPPGSPLDFVCYNINGQTRCHASDGRQTNSYQQICCPSYPNPYPNPQPRSCCRGTDYNACALCLDRRQNTTDPADHQRNMVRCRNACGAVF